MLTPSKIKNHHFEIAGKNAYRAQSVDEFFDIVADSYEQMFRENGELVKKIGPLAQRVEEYKNDEDNIRAALLTAQRMADRIMKETNQKSEAQLAETAAQIKKQKDESDAKSKALIEDAEKKAALIIADAEKKANQIIDDATRESKEAEVVARDRMIKAQAGLDLIEKEADKFKLQLLALYSEHIELINKIPDAEQPYKQDTEETAEIETEEAAEAEIPQDEIAPVQETVEEKTEDNAEIQKDIPQEQPEAETEDIEELVIEEPSEEIVQEQISEAEEAIAEAPVAEAAEYFANEEIPQSEGFSVEELADKYADVEYQDAPEQEEDIPVAQQEQPAVQEDAMPLLELDNEEEPVNAEVQPAEPMKFDFDDSVPTQENEPKVGGFKFNFDSIDDDKSGDDFYDDDEGEYDDDDDDDDSEGGFSSKLKGFFKR